MMAAVASHRLLSLVLFAALASPAMASDASVSFQCCRYTPDSVRILPNEKVTFTGTGGADFTSHPLRFDDATYGQENSGTTAFRTFATDGLYTWYCNIHGINGGAMRGKVAVTTNNLPVASFTASATSVASGTEVSFDANGSSDPDFGIGQSLNYTWDLNGDGVDDPGATSPTPSAVFTNAGTTARNVAVRLTATDTNSDAVGPESATKTMIITVAPVGGGTTPPGGGGTTPLPGGTAGTGPAADTAAPKVQLTLAKRLTVRSKLRLTFTIDEPASVIASLKVGRRTAKVSRDFDAAGKHAVTLKLTKALRRLLRHRRKVTITLAVTDLAGNGTTLKRAVRLRSR
jgi:plastocyanin